MMVLFFAEAVSLGLITYGMGLLPLCTSSNSSLSAMTILGTGRLLGSAGAIVAAKLFLGAASTYMRSAPFSRTAMTLSDVGGILFILIADGRLSFPFIGAGRRRRPRADSNPHERLPLVALHSGQDSMNSTDLEPFEPGSAPQATVPDAVIPRMTPISRHYQRRIYWFTFALVIHEIARAIDIKVQVLNGLTRMAPDTSVEETAVLVTASAYLYSATRQGLMGIALATTLRLAALPIPSCKQHVLVFAAAPTIVKLFAYIVVVFFQITVDQYRSLPLVVVQSFTSIMVVYAVFMRRSLIKSPVKNGRGFCMRFLLLGVGALLPWTIAMTLIAINVLTNPHVSSLIQASLE
ncbi:hypothetical protein DICSQDRAFT_182303 [Dichomitus squalens LYAD-421 SS1]|uniref:Uncharacterized protein n=1 Tax=Dichomitus squalens (strain LYAD-421) TaxID=732165 RepID=R7SUY9_DICSQ|nr:uncharacterized protein DICSQDRAFT_182303 [Dichomitus squalens LYAD-421 SS1]EJF58782.1 hypothetical protein DICSQDRAFT_182303 [Dichomitus squalens LYAD-421 SS1]